MQMICIAWDESLLQHIGCYFSLRSRLVDYTHKNLFLGEGKQCEGQGMNPPRCVELCRAEGSSKYWLFFNQYGNW